MTKLDAHLNKEDQLCIAIKAVREALPLPQKMVMAKLSPDYAGELVCASMLMPTIGSSEKYMEHDLHERLIKAFTDAKRLIATLGPEYENLSGLESAMAITNLAIQLLKK